MAHRRRNMLHRFVALVVSVSAVIQAFTPQPRPIRPSGTSRLQYSVGATKETLVNITMLEHRPSMGCTVEESLADEGLVFVSSVQGHAAAAGLQLGDVVVGVTGLFGNVEMVRGMGLEKVSSLIAGRSDDEPLELCIARGTSVMADHEESLAELCADPDKSDQEAELCLTEFLSGGYDFDDNVSKSGNIEEETRDSELLDPSETMVADLQSIWAQDWLPDPVESDVKDDVDSTDNVAEKPKPWSSRSSPSGTFVRDPRTGKMRNIDA